MDISTGKLTLEQYRTSIRDRGINLNPPYRRGDVWPNSRKEFLMRSIVHEIPIPPVSFVEENGAWSCIDGRQRLNTIYEFLTDLVQYRGHYSSYYDFNREMEVPYILYRGLDPSTVRNLIYVHQISTIMSNSDKLHIFTSNEDCNEDVSSIIFSMSSRLRDMQHNGTIRNRGRMHETSYYWTSYILLISLQIRRDNPAEAVPIRPWGEFEYDEVTERLENTGFIQFCAGYHDAILRIMDDVRDYLSRHRVTLPCNRDIIGKFFYAYIASTITHDLQEDRSSHSHILDYQRIISESAYRNDPLPRVQEDNDLNDLINQLNNPVRKRNGNINMEEYKMCVRRVERYLYGNRSNRRDRDALFVRSRIKEHNVESHRQSLLAYIRGRHRH